MYGLLPNAPQPNAPKITGVSGSVFKLIVVKMFYIFRA